MYWISPNNTHFIDIFDNHQYCPILTLSVLCGRRDRIARSLMLLDIYYILNAYAKIGNFLEFSALVSMVMHLCRKRFPIGMTHPCSRGIMYRNAYLKLSLSIELGKFRLKRV